MNSEKLYLERAYLSKAWEQPTFENEADELFAVTELMTQDEYLRFMDTLPEEKKAILRLKIASYESKPETNPN